ncbi:type II toxin-antitoxin system CcdA family antitoxin [Mangrovicella endophytica]|uniref:type II toxin-antitoxin system CcdA family antitoxin n=1 Tax=Mangrovicella endophytica TaxID=2066697 RepID=UPI000C9E7B2C|nr:type II toxin-antitoxin system CcdA family antitoxin [Mangrovicella endophytica]
MNEVVIDPGLLAEAEALDIDVSHAASTGVAQAVRAKRQSLWREQNAEALTSSNEYVERNGLPLAAHRVF